jgi:uncharacterized membrane protein
MKDFIDWLKHDSPEWARVTGAVLILLSIFAAFGILIFFLNEENWFVLLLFPAVAIWIVLREYKKSKE